MLFCPEWPVIMFACDTLCVSVPHPETSRHAVAWREVSGCHVHCKESLGGKARVLAMAVHLQMLMTCCQGTLFYPFRFHSHASLRPVWQSMSAFVVIRQKCLRVFHGQSSSGLWFCKKSSSFLSGERICSQKT